MFNKKILKLKLVCKQVRVDVDLHDVKVGLWGADILFSR